MVELNNRRDEIIKGLSEKHNCSEQEVIKVIDSLDHVWEALQKAISQVVDTVKGILENTNRYIEQEKKRNDAYCSHLRLPKLKTDLTMTSQIPKLKPLQAHARSNL